VVGRGRAALGRAAAARAVLATLLLVAFLVPYEGSGRPPSPTPGEIRADIPDSFFLENVGQLGRDDVRFYAALEGLRVGFAPSTVLLDQREASRTDGSRGAIVRVTFPGSEPTEPRGSTELLGQSHFFLGNDTGRWRTGVRHFGEVRFDGLYQGIDLVYRLARGVKYEFHVRPGANPDAIGILYEGVDGVRLEDLGLTIDTAVGVLRDTPPVAFQGSERVSCPFVARGPRTIGFACGPHDESRTLVIDPLVYSTYLGGSGNEDGYAITTDANGYAYVTGRTTSPTYPMTVGAYDTSYNAGLADVFVTKLNQTGALVYSTFLGGSDYESGVGIAVDGSGAAYVMGETFSGNFPTTAGAFDTSFNGISDAYVAKLSPGGNALTYSTFLGGSDWDAPTGSSIVVDASGATYVTGRTESSDFPTTAGAFDTSYNGLGDVFVTKILPGGTGIAYAGFLGGSDSEAEAGASLAIDGIGNAYVSGDTRSSNFPTTPGAFDPSFGGVRDSFATKVNPAGSALVYSTYIGGSDEEISAWRGSIQVGPGGVALISGLTRSSDFPTTPGAFDETANGLADAFVLQLDAAGANLVWATYVGTPSNDYGRGIALDPSGSPVLIGYTESPAFPVTAGAFDGSYNGAGDVVVVRVSATGDALLYGSYLGGSATDDGLAIARDPLGFVYATGQTSSPNFPTLGSGDLLWNGGRDVFVTKLELDYPNQYPITVETDPPGLQVSVDGSAYTAPYPFTCTGNTSFLLEAPSPQFAPGTQYTWTTWSDAGARSHAVTCIAPDTYLATFSAEFNITVLTDPSGLQALVNGVAYTTPHAVTCVDGTTFSLDAPSPQFAPGTRYLFASWSDGRTQSHSVVCDGPGNHTATFATEWEVTLLTVPPGLALLVNGTAVATPHTFWCPSDTAVVLSALDQGGPTVRYVYRSWSDAGAQTHPLTCNGPATLTATFDIEYRISIDTVPSGLEVNVSGSPRIAPHSEWCAAGSRLPVEAPSPQGTGRTRHVFASWSDGGPRSHVVDCSEPKDLVATFGTEHEIRLDTVPPSLLLILNASTVATPYAFWCSEGTEYAIGAPTPQGSGSTRQSFQSWSDGGPRTRAVPCVTPGDHTAIFAAEHLVIVYTTPPGLDVELSGARMPTPASVWCPEGTGIAAVPPSPQGDNATRYVFDSWADGAAEARTIACNAPGTYTANFVTEHRIVVATDPPGYQVTINGATVASPASFWCPEGSRRRLSVPMPQGNGFVRDVFSSWSDDGERAHEILCTGPAAYTARFTPDWKPLLAISFAIVLAAVGAFVAATAAQHPLRRDSTGKAWLLVAFPFVAVEATTGIVDWFTAWLMVPPIAGLGTFVDVSILLAGLLVQIWYARRQAGAPSPPPDEGPTPPLPPPREGLAP